MKMRLRPLSYGSIKKFENCPESWLDFYYTNPVEDREMSEAAQKGMFIHSLIEDWIRGKEPTRELDKEETFLFDRAKYFLKKHIMRKQVYLEASRSIKKNGGKCKWTSSLCFIRARSDIDWREGNNWNIIDIKSGWQELTLKYPLQWLVNASIILAYHPEIEEFNFYLLSLRHGVSSKTVSSDEVRRFFNDKLKTVAKDMTKVLLGKYKDSLFKIGIHCKNCHKQFRCNAQYSLISKMEKMDTEIETSQNYNKAILLSYMIKSFAGSLNKKLKNAHSVFGDKKIMLPDGTNITYKVGKVVSNWNDKELKEKILHKIMDISNERDDDLFNMLLPLLHFSKTNVKSIMGEDFLSTVPTKISNVSYFEKEEKE